MFITKNDYPIIVAIVVVIAFVFAAFAYDSWSTYVMADSLSSAASDMVAKAETMGDIQGGLEYGMRNAVNQVAWFVTGN